MDVVRRALDPVRELHRIRHEVPAGVARVRQPAVVDVDVLVARVLHAVVCIASAVSLISDSLTLQPNAFQSLYPIGGVSAWPSSIP